MVIRHKASIAVLTELLSQAIPDDLDIKHVEQFNLSMLENIDVVVGVLPVHLIAELTSRGVRFFGLSMNVPREMRGKELSELQVRALNPRLQEFLVFKEDPRK